MVLKNHLNPTGLIDIIDIVFKAKLTDNRKFTKENLIQSILVRWLLSLTL
jgi:hypothetical protein